MKCIQLCLLCADGLMLVGYSKIGYRYLFLPPACIRGLAFICPYRPRPRLLSEARPLIESWSLFEDLRYFTFSNVGVNHQISKLFTVPYPFRHLISSCVK